MILQEGHNNPHILNKLFGIYRIWGHPTVSGIDGNRKSKEVVINEHITNYEAVPIISKKWREVLVISQKKGGGPISRMKLYNQTIIWPNVLEEIIP